VNHTYPIEDNSHEFFDRLYKQAEKNKTQSLLKRIENHEVSIGRTKRLTLQECEAVVERYLNTSSS
jgi:hypothetical protein